MISILYQKLHAYIVCVSNRTHLSELSKLFPYSEGHNIFSKNTDKLIYIIIEVEDAIYICMWQKTNTYYIYTLLQLLLSLHCNNSVTKQVKRLKN